MSTFLSIKSIKSIQEATKIYSKNYIQDNNLGYLNSSINLISESKIYQNIKETDEMYHEKYKEKRHEKTSFFKKSVIKILPSTNLKKIENEINIREAELENLRNQIKTAY